MLKRPTSRRRSREADFDINIVPLLDTLVTLIAFLMFSMSIINVVSLDSFAPTQDSKSINQPIKKKPLQLTLSFQGRGMLLWSPFGRIKERRIRDLADGTPNLVGLHQELIKLKNRFPTENQLILMPSADLSYELLIKVMDSIRSLEATDPTIYVKNPKTGVDEVAIFLFPDIVFGNLMDGG
jgi:biopolymer transport protein ExbD